MLNKIHNNPQDIHNDKRSNLDKSKNLQQTPSKLGNKSGASRSDIPRKDQRNKK